MTESDFDNIHRFPSCMNGGILVRAVSGQGTGEIYAEGDVTTDKIVRAAGAEISGAMTFGRPECPSTCAGDLYVEGALLGPGAQSSERNTLQMPYDTWTPMPVGTEAGRLLLVLAETADEGCPTSVGFLAVGGSTGCINILIREPGTSRHIVARNGTEGICLACIREPEEARGIAQAIRPCPSDEKEADDCPSGSESIASEEMVTIRLRIISA